MEVATVYNKIGANGLLRYAALVASSVDEKKISNFSMNLDGCQMVEIFLKNLLANKYFDGIMCRDFAEQDSFDGITLTDSAVTRLETSMIILAYAAHYPGVAVSLYG